MCWCKSENLGMVDEVNEARTVERMKRIAQQMQAAHNERFQKIISKQWSVHHVEVSNIIFILVYFF